MAAVIRTCEVHEIVHVSDAGEFDQSRVLAFVQEIGEIARRHPGYNFLLDMRETRLTAGSMADIVEASIKAEHFEELHQIKIAGVIPDEPVRTVIASRAEGLLQWKSIDYRVFTSFDDAHAWLAT